MNTKYIKRQIILHDLGISINTEIRNHITNIYKLIGDISLYEKQYGVDICWSKNNETVFTYHTFLEYLTISNEKLWEYLYKHKSDSFLTIPILNHILEVPFNHMDTIL